MPGGPGPAGPAVPAEIATCHVHPRPVKEDDQMTREITGAQSLVHSLEAVGA
ncbi:hypothetical protein, partial [Frankia casuarinae]|uniref:hypothetical protein n=1 Tax=Frankia casuarinae (strain DSM 45818 / CECT 9043 / HFP020203 / CcI3) TaxID=106370 RepID=UPI0036F2A470